MPQSSIRRFWLEALGGIALMGSVTASTAFAQRPIGTGKGATPVKADPIAKKNEHPSPEPKTIAFTFSDAPWETVIRWFAKETNTAFVGTEKPPTGTFNFFPPNDLEGKVKLYTIPEIVDIINDALITKGYIMARQEGTFTLLPADSSPDPSQVPLVSIDDLKHRGKKEVVRIRVALKNTIASEVAAEIKPLLGKFGVVAAMDGLNYLVFIDQVGTLREVVEFLQNLEKSQERNDMISRSLRFIKARDAEETLRKFVGDSPAVPEDAARMKLEGRIIPNQPPVSNANRKVKPLSIAVDERLNTIFVSGPPDTLAKAKKLLEEIDKPEGPPPGTPITPGSPVLMTHNTQPGTAEVMARSLLEIHKPSQSLKIWAFGQSQIMVWASVDDQVLIAKHIRGIIETKSTVTKIIKLRRSDAARMAATLREMHAPAERGGPFIGENERNGIVVKGTPEQVAEIEAYIRLDEEQSSGESPRRTIIKTDSSSALAEALKDLLEQMGYNTKMLTPKLDGAPPKEKASGTPR